MVDLLDRRGALERSKGARLSQTVAWPLNRPSNSTGEPFVPAGYAVVVERRHFPHARSNQVAAPLALSLLHSGRTADRR